ncbi:MAG: MlaD family protein [Halothiobacillaceae bacterium]|jgi:phospholipid/cholesterol/gamma-HCH transport system substrate-binding protein|nr:MlaD family protein [Halothiobacillaceae bacterium]
METRISYAAVGLFVLLFGIATVGLGLWLAKGTDRIQYERYAIQTTESVSGLNISSPVKYRGVDVGKVVSISLDKEHPERVIVLLDIEHDVPIKTGTRAKLAPQGVTGLSTINLTGGYSSEPDLRALPNEKYPVIPLDPSLLDQLGTGINDIMYSLSLLANRLNDLLNKQNIDNVGAIINHVEEVTRTLAESRDSMRQFVDESRLAAQQARQLAQDSRATVQSARAVTDRLLPVVEQLSVSLEAVRDAAVGARAASDKVKGMAQVGSEQLQIIGEETQPEVQRLLGDLRGLTLEMTNLAREMRTDPNRVLVGPPTRPRGPGE